MTAPKTCPDCGASLDAGEACDCKSDQEPVKEAGGMEFVMGSSLEGLPKTIDFNFLELKSELEERLELYRGMVVTEDGIKAAKEDRARLNKLREALETKRKEIKRECMAPYTDFEAKVKELVGLIDQPIAAIDGQLKAYEEKRRGEKREAVLAIYEEVVGEMRDLLPFDRVWRNEWYNTGVSMKKIREAITAAEEKAASDLAVLATVESEFAEAVKLKYLDTLDLNAALAERARLRERAEKLRAYEEEQARAKAAEAERLADASIKPAAAEPAAATREPGGGEAAAEPMNHTQDDEAKYRLCFECCVTRVQAAALAAWLQERNIPYRRV